MVKFERLMTNCVGAGSAWPKLENSSAKTGMTQTEQDGGDDDGDGDDASPGRSSRP